MKASIVIVGDEILIGQVTDTNSGWICQKLNGIGIEVIKIITVGDEYAQIVSGMEVALEASDVLLMTGGLGPTKDDITKKAIAGFLGVDLFFHEPTFERIKKIFERLGRILSPYHHDQCMMPEGVEILHNSMGTAPGMCFRYNSKQIISMPGVPFEMKAIMEEQVLPRFRNKSDLRIVHKTIMTACTGETIIENKIRSIVNEMPEYINIAYLPSLGAVRVRLTGKGRDGQVLEEEISYYARCIAEALGPIVYGWDDTTLEQAVQQLCIDKKIKVGTAESCTGGAIAARIVTVPGSSDYFYGGVVSYSNNIKCELLHVAESTLQNYGAVSEHTVKEMVAGAINQLKVDVAIAVSGIAGPNGGTPEKPVGTIWICVGNKSVQETYLLKAGKDRTKNIETTVVYALDFLRRFILKNY